MINNRYDKLNIMLHLQNQKSHYKRIIQARNHINFKSTSIQSKDSLHLNNKVQHNRTQQITQNNHKLFNKIHEISNKAGLLQSIQSQFYLRHLSMRNTHKFTQKYLDDVIIKQNNKFANKLSDVKPIVGNVIEWNKCWKKFKKDSKRIQKYTNCKMYNPQSYLRNTLSQLTKTNIKQFQRYSSVTKNSLNLSPNPQKPQNPNPSHSTQLSIIKQKSKHTSKPKTHKHQIQQSIQFPKIQYQQLKSQINLIISNDQHHIVKQQQTKQSFT